MRLRGPDRLPHTTMPYLVVLLVSVAVGALVYVLSMRAGGGGRFAVGFGSEDSPQEGSDPAAGAAVGYTYLQVAVTRGPSLRQRLQGLVGSLVLIVAAAIALAGALYAVGWLVTRTVERFVGE